MAREEAALLKDIVDALFGSPSASFVAYSVRKEDDALYVFNYVQPVTQTPRAYAARAKVLAWFAALASKVHQCRLWAGRVSSSMQADVGAMQSCVHQMVNDFEADIAEIDRLLSSSTSHISLLSLYSLLKSWEGAFEAAIGMIRSSSRLPSADKWWRRLFASYLVENNLDRLLRTHWWMELPAFQSSAASHSRATDGCVSAWDSSALTFTLHPSISESEARCWAFLKQTRYALQEALLLAAPRGVTEFADELSSPSTKQVLQALVNARGSTALPRLVLDTISTIEDRRVARSEDLWAAPIVATGLAKLRAMDVSAVAFTRPQWAQHFSSAQDSQGYCFDPIVDDPSIASRTRDEQVAELTRKADALEELATLDCETRSHVPMADMFQPESLLLLARALRSAVDAQSQEGESSDEPSATAASEVRLCSSFLPASMHAERLLTVPLAAQHLTLQQRAWNVMHTQHQLMKHWLGLTQGLWLGDGEVLSAARDLLSANTLDSITFSTTLVEQSLAQSVEHRLRQLLPSGGVRHISVAPPLTLPPSHSSSSEKASDAKEPHSIIATILRLRVELHYDWPLSTFFTPALLEAWQKSFLPLARLLSMHWLVGHWWRDVVSSSVLYMSRNNYGREDAMTEEAKAIRRLKRVVAHGLVRYQSHVSALLGMLMRHVHHKLCGAFRAKHLGLQQSQPSLTLLQYELSKLIHRVSCFVSNSAQDVAEMARLGLRAFSDLTAALQCERRGSAAIDVVAAFRVADISWREASGASRLALTKLRSMAVGDALDDPYAFTVDELWQLEEAA